MWPPPRTVVSLLREREEDLNKIKSGNSILETTFFLLMVWGVAVTGYSARLWFFFFVYGERILLQDLDGRVGVKIILP